jgi:triosephosphate isomerase
MAIGKPMSIGGNWKFHQPLRESNVAVNHALDLQNLMHNSGITTTGVRIYPSFTALEPVARRINTYIGRDLARLRPRGGQALLAVGAQDIFWVEDGSFTGAPPSGRDLRTMGVGHTLIGHSETRAYFGVTDARVAGKLEAAIRNNIFATVCLGEDAEEKVKGRTLKVLEGQIVDGIIPALMENGDTETPLFEIAYEPLYAIAGFAKLKGLPPQAAKIKDIEQAHEEIRRILAFHGFPKLAQSVNILYGGSSNAKNAEELLSLPYVGGLLAGTASWELDSFIEMIKIAERLGRAAG